jgi:heterodisulfide reductase subunit A-like polyferredoxin
MMASGASKSLRIEWKGWFVMDRGQDLITTQASQQDSPAVTGAVMVVGGGIAGMQAALDLANSGYLVHLVEKSPAIGGLMAQLDKTFPTNDCAM